MDKETSTMIDLSTLAAIIGSFVVFALGALLMLLKGLKGDLNKMDDKKVDKEMCVVKHNKRKVGGNND